MLVSMAQGHPGWIVGSVCNLSYELARNLLGLED